MAEQAIDQDVKLRLCLLLDATKTCPKHDTVISKSVAKRIRAMGCKCDGTGHVYLLDPDGEFELRVKCPNWKLRHSVQGSAYGCGVCENRGWIPTDDPWAYVRAAVHIYRPLGEKDFDLKTALETAFKQWLWSWEDPDPGEAAFKVVVEALLKISVSEPRRIMIIKKIIDMGHG